MRAIPLLVLFSLLLSIPLPGVEILTNGDFEQPFTTGWSESASAPSYTITRGTHYDPDPDYEANIYQGSGSGYARLFQIVAVPSTDIDFSINAKLYAWKDVSRRW